MSVLLLQRVPCCIAPVHPSPSHCCYREPPVVSSILSIQSPCCIIVVRERVPCCIAPVHPSPSHCCYREPPVVSRLSIHVPLIVVTESPLLYRACPSKSLSLLLQRAPCCIAPVHPSPSHCCYREPPVVSRLSIQVPLIVVTESPLLYRACPSMSLSLLLQRAPCCIAPVHPSPSHCCYREPPVVSRLSIQVPLIVVTESPLLYRACPSMSLSLLLQRAPCCIAPVHPSPSHCCYREPPVVSRLSIHVPLIVVTESPLLYRACPSKSLSLLLQRAPCCIAPVHPSPSHCCYREPPVVSRLSIQVPLIVVTESPLLYRACPSKSLSLLLQRAPCCIAPVHPRPSHCCYREPPVVSRLSIQVPLIVVTESPLLYRACPSKSLSLLLQRAPCCIAPVHPSPSHCCYREPPVVSRLSIQVPLIVVTESPLLYRACPSKSLSLLLQRAPCCIAPVHPSPSHCCYREPPVVSRLSIQVPLIVVTESPLLYRACPSMSLSLLLQRAPCCIAPVHPSPSHCCYREPPVVSRLSIQVPLIVVTESPLLYRACPSKSLSLLLQRAPCCIAPVHPSPSHCCYREPPVVSRLSIQVPLIVVTESPLLYRACPSKSLSLLLQRAPCCIAPVHPSPSHCCYREPPVVSRLSIQVPLIVVTESPLLYRACPSKSLSLLLQRAPCCIAPVHPSPSHCCYREPPVVSRLSIQVPLIVVTESPLLYRACPSKSLSLLLQRAPCCIAPVHPRPSHCCYREPPVVSRLSIQVPLIVVTESPLLYRACPSTSLSLLLQRVPCCIAPVHPSPSHCCYREPPVVSRLSIQVPLIVVTESPLLYRACPSTSLSLLLQRAPCCIAPVHPSPSHCCYREPPVVSRLSIHVPLIVVTESPLLYRACPSTSLSLLLQRAPCCIAPVHPRPSHCCYREPPVVSRLSIQVPLIVVTESPLLYRACPSTSLSLLLQRAPCCIAPVHPSPSHCCYREPPVVSRLSIHVPLIVVTESPLLYRACPSKSLSLLLQRAPCCIAPVHPSPSHCCYREPPVVSRLSIHVPLIVVTESPLLYRASHCCYREPPVVSRLSIQVPLIVVTESPLLYRACPSTSLSLLLQRAPCCIAPVHPRPSHCCYREPPVVSRLSIQVPLIVVTESPLLYRACPSTSLSLLLQRAPCCIAPVHPSPSHCCYREPPVVSRLSIQVPLIVVTESPLLYRACPSTSLSLLLQRAPCCIAPVHPSPSHCCYREPPVVSRLSIHVPLIVVTESPLLYRACPSTSLSLLLQRAPCCIAPVHPRPSHCCYREPPVVSRLSIHVPLIVVTESPLLYRACPSKSLSLLLQRAPCCIAPVHPRPSHCCYRESPVVSRLSIHVPLIVVTESPLLYRACPSKSLSLLLQRAPCCIAPVHPRPSHCCYREPPVVSRLSIHVPLIVVTESPLLYRACPSTSLSLLLQRAPCCIAPVHPRPSHCCYRESPVVSRLSIQVPLIVVTESPLLYRACPSTSLSLLLQRAPCCIAPVHPSPSHCCYREPPVVSRLSIHVPLIVVTESPLLYRACPSTSLSLLLQRAPCCIAPVHPSPSHCCYREPPVVSRLSIQVPLIVVTESPLLYRACPSTSLSLLLQRAPCCIAPVHPSPSHCCYREPPVVSRLSIHVPLIVVTESPLLYRACPSTSLSLLLQRAPCCIAPVHPSPSHCCYREPPVVSRLSIHVPLIVVTESPLLYRACPSTSLSLLLQRVPCCIAPVHPRPSHCCYREPPVVSRLSIQVPLIVVTESPLLYRACPSTSLSLLLQRAPCCIAPVHPRPSHCCYRESPVVSRLSIHVPLIVVTESPLLYRACPSTSLSLLLQRAPCCIAPVHPSPSHCCYREPPVVSRLSIQVPLIVVTESPLLYRACPSKSLSLLLQRAPCCIAPVHPRPSHCCYRESPVVSRLSIHVPLIVVTESPLLYRACPSTSLSLLLQRVLCCIAPVHPRPSHCCYREPPVVSRLSIHVPLIVVTESPLLYRACPSTSLSLLLQRAPCCIAPVHPRPSHCCYREPPVVSRLSIHVHLSLLLQRAPCCIAPVHPRPSHCCYREPPVVSRLSIQVPLIVVTESPLLYRACPSTSLSLLPVVSACPSTSLSLLLQRAPCCIAPVHPSPSHCCYREPPVVNQPR